jgi:hypothetical protein
MWCIACAYPRAPVRGSVPSDRSDICTECGRHLDDHSTLITNPLLLTRLRAVSLLVVWSSLALAALVAVLGPRIGRADTANTPAFNTSILHAIPIGLMIVAIAVSVVILALTSRNTHTIAEAPQKTIGIVIAVTAFAALGNLIAGITILTWT